MTDGNVGNARPRKQKREKRGNGLKTGNEKRSAFKGGKQQIKHAAGRALLGGGGIRGRKEGKGRMPVLFKRPSKGKELCREELERSGEGGSGILQR